MENNQLTGKKLLDLLRSLNLPSEDFAVFGSGPMYPRGIKDLGHDLDIVARGKAWDSACHISEPKVTQSGMGLVIEIEGGAIEIFKQWWPGNWDLDELIDTADVFDGIKYVSLENVIKWKKEMGRDKDLEHIKMIEEYLETQKSK